MHVTLHGKGASPIPSVLCCSSVVHGGLVGLVVCGYLVGGNLASMLYVTDGSSDFVVEDCLALNCNLNSCHGKVLNGC